MPTATIAGHAVSVDAEGFMTNPQEWTSEIATDIAASVGLTLTERHWKVIEFCRLDAGNGGKAPTLRRITTAAGVTTKEMFALFPKGPAKKVARISGLGKPEGCV